MFPIAAVPIRQPYQTRYKLPLMNWAVLRNQQLRNTVFVGMNDEKVIEGLDMERFEELFKLSGRTIGEGANAKASDAGVNGGATAASGDAAGDALDASESARRLSKRPEKKRLMDPNRHR